MLIALLFVAPEGLIVDSRLLIGLTLMDHWTGEYSDLKIILNWRSLFRSFDPNNHYLADLMVQETEVVNKYSVGIEIDYLVENMIDSRWVTLRVSLDWSLEDCSLIVETVMLDSC